MRRRSPIGRISSALILALILSFVLEAQDNRRLYLVTGFTTNRGPQKVASNLFRVDPIRHDFEFVSELIAGEVGSLSTNVDHERRVVALMSGSNEAVTFSMDTPGVVRRLPIPHDGFQTLASFVDLPGGKVALAVETLTSSGRQSLIGIPLLPVEPAAKPEELAWNNLSSARTEGWWSPGDEKGYGGATELWVKNGKVTSRQSISFSEKRGNEVQLTVPVPREAAAQSDGQRWRIFINNDEILVLFRLFNESAETSGKITLHIYDKKTKVWHTEDFDGDLSSFRGFGSWLAVNQAEANYVVINGTAQPKPVAKESPGKSERQQTLDPQDNYRDQEPIDSLFGDYYPGIIRLYDVRSGRRYRIDTGQGDSEVLLVDGKTIYYRVNATLYRGEIGQRAIQNPTEIVRDANVQLAHWAFLSSK